MSASNYLAAIGTIRVLETKMLREAEVEKILGAENFASAVAVLHDLSFGQFVGTTSGKNNFEEVLQQGLFHIKKMLMDMSDSAEILNILWLPYDLHNAKLLLKGYLLSDDMLQFEHLTWTLGTKSVPALQQLLQQSLSQKANDVVASEDVWIVRSFQKSLQAYRDHKNPIYGEFALDVCFFEKISQIAQKAKNKSISSFVMAFIDYINIFSAVRKFLRNESEVFLLSGGNVSHDVFHQATLEDFLVALPEQWKQKVALGITAFHEEGDISALELQLSEALLIPLAPARIVIDGPEPLIAFFWKKKRNADILRTLFVGKKAGLSESQLRKYIPSKI